MESLTLDRLSPFSERGGSCFNNNGNPDPGGPCGKGIRGRVWRRVRGLDSVFDTTRAAGTGVED